MTDHDMNIQSSHALIPELNRSVDEVSAEISARTSAVCDMETLKRNRRFVSAKAAAQSEAADIARAAARQMTAARTRVLDEIARAEAAGLVVHEDFSVSDTRLPCARTSRADDHASAIRAAVTHFTALHTQVSTRLGCAANALRDLRDT
jgi:hypothetical protein